jgi:cell division protease FtsH
MRGVCYAKMNVADSAMRDFNMALKLDPNLSWAYSCRGLAHLEQGTPAAAVEDFTQVIRIEPRSESAYRNRAIAYLRMKNVSAALSDLNTDVEVNPNKLEAYQARADLWCETEDYVNAIEDYTACLAIEPNNADILGRRAVALYHTKDYEAAIQDLCNALTIQPDVAWLLNWRGYCRLLLHDLENALVDFTQAIKADPSFFDAYLKRARAWRSCGEHEKSLEDLNRAVELDASGVDALLARAKSHKAADNLSLAIADLTEAIHRQPQDARLLRLRAKIYSATGENEKSEADYTSLTINSEADTTQENNTMNRRSKRLFDLIKTNFSPVSIDDVTISERRFPNRVRADIQLAIDRLLADNVQLHFFSGVRKQRAYEGVNFSELLVFDEHDPALSVPPQYEEIGIGGEDTIRCLKDGIWLLEKDERRFVLFLEPASRHGRMMGIRFQIATANDHAGIALSQSFFKKLEEAVFESRCYRGKILSLEHHADYSGVSSGIRVHQLRTVAREDVVLPSMTLQLLERNVIQFVNQRSRLRELGMTTKKGLLFYGPPGTGKTHTIHFLASALKGHTMLLISAEQVGLLDEYMSLARLLQPSIVVIEDVDLIARDREDMASPCEEVLLNKLLNEMDGLKEDADILFILTTNRPGALEAALASRPGRVDQAIEFPLPDEEGLRKLVKLYTPKLGLDEALIQEIVKRCQGVSAAFIKELMRRTVQFSLESGRDGEINLPHVHNALDEMLFKGGTLNLKLLGGKVDEESSL